MENLNPYIETMIENIFTNENQCFNQSINYYNFQLVRD